MTEPAGRYYLQFTRFFLVPRVNKFAERLEQHGPFTEPGSAHEAWTVVFAKQSGVKEPHVVYKEFDL